MFSPASLRSELIKCDGWESVEEFGFLDRNSVVETFEKSIAGLVTFLPLPNHIESQPNKLFEYMSAGLPVIASNFPLWKKIVEENKCGICVDPEKPEEIALAIDFIVNNREQASEMGKNGRKAVIEKYNWKIEESKLLETYSGLTNLNF
jgi:glycosyltransferase involved in cell wall biosynthesis